MRAWPREADDAFFRLVGLFAILRRPAYPKECKAFDRLLPPPPWHLGHTIFRDELADVVVGVVRRTDDNPSIARTANGAAALRSPTGWRAERRVAAATHNTTLAGTTPSDVIHS